MTTTTDDDRTICEFCDSEVEDATPKVDDLYRNRKTGALHTVDDVKLSGGELFVCINRILTTLEGLEEWYEPVKLNVPPGYVTTSPWTRIESGVGV